MLQPELRFAVDVRTSECKHGKPVVVLSPSGKGQSEERTVALSAVESTNHKGGLLT